MDLDAQLKSHHRRLDAVEGFVEKVNTAGELRALIDEARVMLDDYGALKADYAAMMSSFKPTFDWVQAKMAEEQANAGPAAGDGEGVASQPDDGKAEGEANQEPPQAHGEADETTSG